MKRFSSCVRDQHRRGTSAAFALVSAMETLLAQNGRLQNLSEQALYSQMRLMWNRADFGEGGTCGAIAQVMRDERWSVPPEAAWRYNPSPQRRTTQDGYLDSCQGYPGVCSESSHQSQLICTEVHELRYCGFADPQLLFRQNDEEAVGIYRPAEIWDAAHPDLSLGRLLLLARRRPVVVSLAVSTGWDQASRGAGILEHQAGMNNRGSTAVHVVGHVSNATLALAGLDVPPGAGGGYLVVKNSWSTCWGDGGYAYLPFDAARENILSAIVIHGLR
jgi:hypothetical protein